MVFRRLDDNLRQEVRDETDRFEAVLRRNYGWKLSSKKLLETRMAYEREISGYGEVMKKSTEPKNSQPQETTNEYETR